MRHALALCLAAALGALACSSPGPYVFGWPFLDAPLPARGGTTRGAPVELDERPSEDWKRLQAAGLDARARDRAAILALAGDYRASFDFLETVLFEPGAGPARPYRSWGTERIYVVEAREHFVRLQHVLVMFVLDEAGEVQGPFVQKHWRQDWRYEPIEALVYRGGDTFELQPVDEAARSGAWSQTVYQVDDAPRYASIGRWHHEAEASVWEGGGAWRPLPRREHSVRDDYDVLAGTHRLTVLPTGWVHEQDNTKLALERGGIRPVAREAGLARYERLRDFDFSAADAYWSATSAFWGRVREAWARRAEAYERFSVDSHCDGEPGFVTLFRVADGIAANEQIGLAAELAVVDEALDCRVRPE